MAGYTRQSTYTDGDVINAADSNDEFDQLVNTFSNTTGHAHDGTSAEGPVIGLIGDAGITTPLNKIVVDTANDRIGVFVDVASSAVEQVRFQDGAVVPVTDSDVDLGATGTRFKDTYTDSLTVTDNVSVSGDLTVEGNLSFGNASTDTVVFNADINSDLIPFADATYDLGAVGSEWQDLYIDGTAYIDSLVADTADIDAGTIDNATIGGTTPAAGTFTTLTANGNVVLGDAATDTVTFTADVASNLIPSADDTYDLGASGSEWKDLYLDGTANVDTLVIGASTGVTSVDTDLSTVSASDDTLASALAIKTYVDAQVTAQDLDFQADTGGALNIDLDSETLTFTGGTGIDTSGSGNAVTFAIDSTVATLTGTQTLTNKTLTTPVISSISNTGTLTLPTSTDTLVGRATTDTLTNKTLTAPVISTISNTGTLTLPTSTDTLVGRDTTDTLTNKTIDSANNTLTVDLSEATVTGTTAEFNTALSDGSFATLAGTETLTNKSIDASQLTGTVANARLDAQLQDVAGLTPTDGNFIVGDGTNFVAESGATARTSLGLTIGTDVQAYDAGLASIAGLTTSSDQTVYTTGSDTYAVTSLTSFGRSLIDDADASTARTTLGLGTAAVADTGTSAGNVVVLDGTGKLPAVDGSQLTNISYTETDPSALAFAIALG